MKNVEEVEKKVGPIIDAVLNVMQQKHKELLGDPFPEINNAMELDNLQKKFSGVYEIFQDRISLDISFHMSIAMNCLSRLGRVLKIIKESPRFNSLNTDTVYEIETMILKGMNDLFQREDMFLRVLKMK